VVDLPIVQTLSAFAEQGRGQQKPLTASIRTQRGSSRQRLKYRVGPEEQFRIGLPPMKRLRPMLTAMFVGLFLLPLLVTFGIKRSQMEVEVYRQRLRELSDEYEVLRQTYNDAVRQTAVTELVVKGNTLQVAICTADGAEKVIPTPFDPRQEIYVDYIVAGSRLWIRRVFDAHTPPSKGLLIDPQWTQIDWDTPSVRHGKAVYRRLDPGRWIISVTGDGALGLALQTPDEKATLVPSPPVRDYTQLETEVTEAVDRITNATVLHRILAP